ncbi:hypothetical protein DIRTYBETTY_181 [Bacillus phage DirtyBetty]|uniref:SsDNA binding domain protein n=2 Tax=Wphvirus megatron TaxID=1987728 RepID=A0A1B1PAY6_9CAUD|nr:ssDNA binding domain protein [Bacillus phage Eyuki]YP_009285123.1 single strand DNA binding protein [Bacillus phage DirtyBetty]ALA46632.1 ssDNA binding domain protein [Bacillus phage Eyuki]ANT41326.1 hypothetical protein DIRTYBETTY_181 [Bacillus phage DirtyBetty]
MVNFADIIEQQRKELEGSGGGRGGSGNGGNNPKVVYPTAKHKRLFLSKEEPEVFIQILPSADLFGKFAEHCRKIFLSATTKNQKKLSNTFTLTGKKDGSLFLDAKIDEWTAKEMIPTPFGGQQKPKQFFTVNCVKIIENPDGTQFQERDEKGKLVVRLFDVPHSAMKTINSALTDKRLAGGRQLSFLDPNAGSPVLIQKPKQGQMEAPVTVYQNQLPPLGEGWQEQLEDLSFHGRATELLENGLNWVQRFADVLEGKNSNDPDSNVTKEGGQSAPATTNQPVTPANTAQATNPYQTQAATTATQPVKAAPAAPAKTEEVKVDDLEGVDLDTPLGDTEINLDDLDAVDIDALIAEQGL